jgi:predicted phosphodiesterase
MNIRGFLVATILCPLMLALPQQVAHGAAAGADPSVTDVGTDLLRGVKWTYSTDGGKSFSDQAPAVVPGKAVSFQVRGEFEVKDLAGIEVLELTHNVPLEQNFSFQLNGQPVPQPLKDMKYTTLPGLPPSLLKVGKNTLLAEVTYKWVLGKSKLATNFDLQAELEAFGAGHLKFDVGPILGEFGEGYFTVSCRTNMPIAVSLVAAESDKSYPAQVSPAGFYHRFLVKRSTASAGKYFLQADGKTLAQFSSPVWPGESMRLVVLGDSRSYPKDWEKIAVAVRKQSPSLVMHTGDLVYSGMEDALWPKEFYAPAHEILSSIPFYPVWGNHEWGGGILDELFCTPGKDGKGSNWSQQIGSVLLVGLNGNLDWTDRGENYKWLEQVLAGSKAKFIFVANHYPAYSSGPHGVVKDGKPAERPVAEARQYLVPLMAKYKVSGYLVGHDHFYERSELPEGLTHIITGGAGANRYGQSIKADQQNPFVKVFKNKLHYCTIEVQGDKAVLKAIDSDGELIDTVTFKAR